MPAEVVVALKRQTSVRKSTYLSLLKVFWPEKVQIGTPLLPFGNPHPPTHSYMLSWDHSASNADARTRKRTVWQLNDWSIRTGAGRSTRRRWEWFTPGSWNSGGSQMLPSWSRRRPTPATLRSGTRFGAWPRGEWRWGRMGERRRGCRCHRLWPMWPSDGTAEPSPKRNSNLPSLRKPRPRWRSSMPGLYWPRPMRWRWRCGPVTWRDRPCQ